MKKMHLILAGMLVSLTGCWDPATYYLPADELIPYVTKIELAEFNNENPKRVKLNKITNTRFDFNEAKNVKELEKESIVGFINDLSTIRLQIHYFCANFLLKNTILMYMDSNEIVVFSYEMVGEKDYDVIAKFTKEGKFIEYIANLADPDKFFGILNEYFDLD